MTYFSFGGGVQSTAALVLAAQGKLDYSVFLFANVGDDSEHPATLEYIRAVAKPFADSHGIELVELKKTLRGKEQTLLEEVTQRDGNFIMLPMYGETGPGRRACTKVFKVEVIAKETRRRGATKKAPVRLGLGISLDEYQRMSTAQRIPHQINEYPLIDARITRQDCRRIITEAGLPMPPKSACWFCPYIPRKSWQRIKVEEPQRFEQAADLEAYLMQKRQGKGMQPVFLTAALSPMREYFGDQTMMDFDEEDATCESGFCMT